MPPPTCMRCLDAKGHSSLLAGVLWNVGSRLGDQLYLAQAAACVHAQAVNCYWRLRIMHAGLFLTYESTTKELSSRQPL